MYIALKLYYYNEYKSYLWYTYTISVPKTGFAFAIIVKFKSLYAVIDSAHLTLYTVRKIFLRPFIICTIQVICDK